MKLLLHCEAQYYKEFIDAYDSNKLFVELSKIFKDLVFSSESDSGMQYEVNFGKVMLLDKNLLDNIFPEK